MTRYSEIKETCDIKEVAQLLHSGEWVAICATDREPYWFSLGKISQQKKASRRDEAISKET